jgi:sentrin-specific protease 1
LTFWASLIVRHEVLVTHEKSNIDVTRGMMQCLSPEVWLNDEVINVYMELLKEREQREPERFLKCHFFNTFFYNKLYKDKRSYDYKAVRRWTTQKKLGYSLSECDKILVPIHQDIHWCLAVINIRDKRLEYLDSLKGEDDSVLDVLAKYIADEARDKNGKVLDVNSWDQDFPKDIPEQLNGY